MSLNFTENLSNPATAGFPDYQGIHPGQALRRYLVVGHAFRMIMWAWGGGDQSCPDQCPGYGLHRRKQTMVGLSFHWRDRYPVTSSLGHTLRGGGRSAADHPSLGRGRRLPLYSCHSIQPDVSVENIVGFFYSAVKYGKYLLAMDTVRNGG